MFIETLGTCYDVPEDINCKLCFNFETLARTNENHIDLDLDIGEETLLTDRNVKLDNGSSRELTIDDLKICVDHNRGDFIQEHYSCDSDFMLRKVREIGTKARTYFLDKHEHDY